LGVDATYYNNTQAILEQFCVTCYYPDSPLAPFSLASYAEVLAKGSAIIYVLEADTMPKPGSPDLTAADFKLLLGWFINGAPSGVGDVAPVADAGSDQQVDEIQSVTLDASASSDDMNTLTYSWLQMCLN